MMPTMDAEDAWWPPTLTPSSLARPRFAASIIAVESQHALGHGVQRGGGRQRSGAGPGLRDGAVGAGRDERGSLTDVVAGADGDAFRGGFVDRQSKMPL